MFDTLLDKFIVFYNENSSIIKIEDGDYDHARLKFDFFIDDCDDKGISYYPFTSQDVSHISHP